MPTMLTNNDSVKEFRERMKTRTNQNDSLLEEEAWWSCRVHMSSHTITIKNQAP